MIVKYILALKSLILFGFALTDVSSINNNQALSVFTPYGHHLLKTENLRRRFLEKKKEKHKIYKLDNISNTVYQDGILHIAVNKTNVKSKIEEIENAYKSLLGMKGVNYTYKRGFQWRTWREIDIGGNKTIICYKCQSPANETCKTCIDGGYWVIEDNSPPCPFEILSLPNDNQLCTIHFNHFNKISGTCPKLTNLNEILLSCKNPIETEWRVTKKYNVENFERTLDVICGGREACDITTLYMIFPDKMVFRIINSTYDVIYSRVMKINNKNYACIEYCGKFNKETKTVSINDQHVIINLLGSHKNKREYHESNRKTTSVYKYKSIPKQRLLFLKKNINYFGNRIQNMDTNYSRTIIKESTLHPTIFSDIAAETKTISYCKQLANNFQEEDESDSKELDFK